jgi:predicted dehydrogenase
MTRRRFCGAVASAGALMILGTRAAAASGPRLGFGLVGINHEHVFRMVKAVRDGGGEMAMAYAEGAEPQLAEKFFRENPDVRRARSEAEVLESAEVKLVVVTSPPAQRAAVGARAMRAGKDVLADKGGFLNLEDLDTVRRVQAETKRIYSISYNERLLMPVSLKVDELLKAGAIGRVTHFYGFGPHGLTHNPREAWFWTRAGHGGILADVGTHQADQFLHYTGSTRAEVLGAEAMNAENPDHPEFEDYGAMWLKGDGGTGHAEVSFYRGKSAGFLLCLYGTEGSMVVHKPTGQITVTDGRGRASVSQVDPAGPCPFGRLLVEDVLNRTETAMSQGHAFLASELAVRAQLAVERG